MTEHYTKKGLKERGWSEGLIRKLLGEPDERRTNTVYRSAARICLYACERVHETETDSAFLDAQIGREKRREAANKAVETKRSEMRSYLETITIEIPKMSPSRLTHNAIWSYNRDAIDRNRSGWAHKGSDSQFLNRISVNYIRHELTDYDHELWVTSGRVGTAGAYLRIRHTVLDKIAETYPHLESECRKQKRPRC